MKRFAALLVILVGVQQPAATQGPDWAVPSGPEFSQRAKERLVESWCGTPDKGGKRDECARAIEACAAPGALLGFDAMCVRTLWASSVDVVCAAPELKDDKVACLERRVQVLSGQLAALTRDLPKLIDERVKQALEPRLHR
jgi:hypothetical protein